MLKHITLRWRRALLGLLAFTLPLAGFAQNLTQADFTGVLVPQYISSGTATRVPVVYRATVSNLTPNTLYRYFNQVGVSADLGSTNPGAGNPLLITPGATPAATAYLYTSSASLSSANNYGTFTTNASGSYTGWFAFLNTGNTRFTAGNTVFPTIVVAPDATPATVEKRLALNQTMTVLAFGTGATATDASGFKGSSSATPKNLVAVYDNVDGTGRPLALAVVEAIAATGATVASLPAYYTAAAGDWNTLIPNVLPTGVRRIEQFSVVDAAPVGCASDADGVWPSSANTVNPAAGVTAVALTATDAPLNTSACTGAPTASITATPATLTAFSTAVGTASASQLITVGGTTLTADLVVTAPAGYEVSLAAASGYAATVNVAQAAGTAANTPVYVRLIGTTVGSYAGNVTVASTGATTANVAVTGTVTSAATPAPTIASFTPTTGPVGATVTVTGTELTGATAVTLNGAAITGFTVVDAATITFAVPTGATSGPISVTTPGGTATSTGTFTVTVPAVAPVISALAPNAQVVGGPDATLTITGTGFTPTSTVNFNSVSYTQTSSTATTLVVTIPAAALATAGNFPVSVTNAAGTSNAFTFTVSNPSTAGAFEDFETGTKAAYAAGPVTLTSGVWTFTEALIGTTFSDRFNGLKSARIRGGGSVAMTFDKPTGAGTVTVNAALYGVDTGASFILEVSGNGGTSYTTVAGAPATLTATLTPYTFTVNQAGNVRFRISSTNATAMVNPRISIDDISITDFTAPTNPVPAITAITPNTAVAGPAISVTLTGTGFTAASVVNVDGVAIPSTFVSATQLTGTVPVLAPAGIYSVTVVNPTPGGGTSNAVTLTLTAAPVAPTISSFTPTTGGPGTTVTITGTGFTGATAVSIGTFAVTSFTVVSATSITLVVPSGTGSVSGLISVVTPSGTATSATPFALVSATLASQALPGLAVFPNPATDRLTVVLPTAGAATVALRDLTGRVVLAPAPLAADQQLRLPAGLATGMYLLEVRQGAVTAVRRIEKN
ncbi:IPT/TIG domain-containing protein [Hymenobacter sp.]|uniref:IPT/TIG domain-containing protein n=1 Tax=Hymenobacter sp. TaxID=1898978 RepID=UPI00286C96F8|nr:IPT/TIG domain-containing protein [Hymenobacter sp.]